MRFDGIDEVIERAACDFHFADLGGRVRDLYQKGSVARCVVVRVIQTR